MHPPPFLLSQRLSDWPKCFIEPRCDRCGGRSTSMAVWRMIELHGDRTFKEMLQALKCSQCGEPPAPVYLCASHVREWMYGSPADWAVELVPPPRVTEPPTTQAPEGQVLPFPFAIALKTR